MGSTLSVGPADSVVEALGGLAVEVVVDDRVVGLWEVTAMVLVTNIVF